MGFYGYFLIKFYHHRGYEHEKNGGEFGRSDHAKYNASDAAREHGYEIAHFESDAYFDQLNVAALKICVQQRFEFLFLNHQVLK
jgi:hypothetical protein